MTAVPPHDEDRLGELLALLSPVPAGWVRAAQELPAARSDLDEIVERARADASFRAGLVADLEVALAASGYAPSAELVEALRSRLSELDA